TARKRPVRPHRRRLSPFFQAWKLILNRIGETVLPCTAVIVDKKIPAQPRQPGDKRTLVQPIALERSKDSQKNFLCQILGLGIASRETITKAINPAGVDPYQLLPTGGITAQATFNERVI